MKSLETLIAGHAFFQGLDPDHVTLLAGCASNRAFKRDQLLCRVGETANHFFVLRAGRVAIEIPHPSGVIRVQTVDEGDVIGWSWLIPPHEWRFDGRALEATRVLALDAKCLRDKCKKDHDFGYEILSRFTRIVVDRLEATRLQLLDLYGVPG